MNPKVMIWLSVLLSAFAQIFLKHGLTKIQAARSGESSLSVLLIGVVRQPYIWLWGFSFVVALMLWLAGLRELDLSYAYPLVSIGYVVVTIMSAIVFREKVDGNRWLAVAVISLGVVLIAGS
ncbi:MAG TPA: EamA family transporter [Terriglobales bacterium]|nr:EamA family transporter [Terriglobales bacterium]